MAMALIAPLAHADDFSEMLQDVNANHPAIAAERSALDATKTGIGEAYSGFLPSANAAYDRGRQRIQYNQLQPRFEATSGKQLTVNQPLFNGGGTVAGIQAAYARAESGTARLKRVQQQVLLDAIAAYIDIVEKQSIFDMSRRNVEALTTRLGATRKQFKAGELTITDISQSEARLAAAKAQLHDAQAALADANATYVRETGKPPTASHFPPLPVSLPKNAEEIEPLLAAHPAVIEAQENEKVADFTVDQRVAAVLPEVRLQGQLNDQDASTAPGTFSTNGRSIMLRVSVPLSYGDYSRIGEARDRYSQARYQTTDVARDTLKTALREWHNYTAAGLAITENEEAVKAGERALASVRKEQVAGTRTVLDVLNEQNELYTTQINLTRAKSRHTLSAYRLLAALGQLEPVLSYQSASAE